MDLFGKKIKNKSDSGEREGRSRSYWTSLLTPPRKLMALKHPTLCSVLHLEQSLADTDFFLM
jgi:hypothetical protein